MDCHLHSIHSDGAYTPEQLALVYVQLGYDFAVLTDHDTLAGTEKFKRLLKQYGVKSTTGVEITSRYRGGEIHILAYRVDPEDSDLLRLLENVRKARVERAMEMITILNRLGYRLTFEEVKLHMTGQVVGRPHIAKAMVSKGYIGTVKEAFTPEFMADNGRVFMPPMGPEVDEVVEIIRKAGGVAVVAHPGTFVDGRGNRGINGRQMLELRDMGVEGIEVFHPKHSSQDMEFYLSLSKELGMFVSCGSDFHDGEIYNVSGYVSQKLQGELERCSEVLSLF